MDRGNGRMTYDNKLAYGVGHVYNNLIGTMWFTYVLVYLQYVMQLPASTAGVVLMVGQVVEAFATPITGMESDRIKGCGNYGRRKSTHLFGSILTLLTFPFVFIELPGFDKASPEALLAFFIPVVFIYKVGWASVQVSHLSMMPEMSSDPSDRDDLAILRYTFDMASDMVVYFVTWWVFSERQFQPLADEIDTTTIDQTDGWRFQTIVLILVGIGSIFNILFHVFTVETPPLPQEASVSERLESLVVPTDSKSADSVEGEVGSDPPGISMKWSDWFREKDYFQVLILLVLARLFLNINQAIMPLFLQEGVRAPQEYLAIIPGVGQFSALAASLFVKVLLRYYSKKVVYMVGTGIAFTGCIWLGLDSPEDVRNGSIFIVAVLIGAGTGMMTVLSTSFVSDLIAQNTESGAYVFGSIAFIHNLLNGLVVLLVQLGHGLCEECPSYYRNFLAHGLSTLAVISLALVLFLDPTKLGKRHSGRNTSKGREMRLAKKNKKYGAMQKGFPLLKGTDNT